MPRCSKSHPLLRGPAASARRRTRSQTRTRAKCKTRAGTSCRFGGSTACAACPRAARRSRLVWTRCTTFACCTCASSPGRIPPMNWSMHALHRRGIRSLQVTSTAGERRKLRSMRQAREHAAQRLFGPGAAHLREATSADMSVRSRSGLCPLSPAILLRGAVTIQDPWCRDQDAGNEPKWKVCGNELYPLSPGRVGSNAKEAGHRVSAGSCQGAAHPNGRAHAC